MNGQLHTGLLYSRGRNPGTIEQEEAGWAPEPVWMFWRGVKSLAPLCKETSDRLACSLVTTLTELFRLLKFKINHSQRATTGNARSMSKRKRAPEILPAACFVLHCKAKYAAVRDAKV